jgi:hypothetical protein
LPRPGSMSTVHLVSVEGRFGTNGFDFNNEENDQSIRLVSLYSWRFASISEKHTFKGLLTHLDPGTLRLQDIIDENANKYFSMGCVPLHHEMRQGNKSVSWYHGPLIPGSYANNVSHLPACSSDELVRYDTKIGMFDVSYAAAWELGRLLTLQNKRVSFELFNWKRSQAKLIKDAKRQPDDIPSAHPIVLDMPEVVQTWFDNLALLIDLPFNYLVPDERLLPIESIRFFQVDPLWVKCLLDGAFSIGRVLAGDQNLDSILKGCGQEPTSSPLMSGLLLRSDLVSGWPGLLVDGRGDNLNLVRMDRLSKNILICLFRGEGIVEAVDIYQKPETMHFVCGDTDSKRATNSAAFASEMFGLIEKVGFIQKPVG